MESLRIIAAAMLVIVTAALATAAMPARSIPLKPRHEWRSEKLDGYIVSINRIFWTADFYFVESHDEDPLHTGMRLMFADDAAFKRATILQDTPVFVTAIPVKAGGDRYYLVESIVEPN